MRYFFKIFFPFFLFFTKIAFSQFVPSDLPNLHIWLKGDSVHVNGAGIDTIYDCSGNKNDAIQATPSNQPVLIDSITGINNKPVIRFDGTKDMTITTNIINNASAYTVFAVVKYTTNGSSSLMSGNVCSGNCSESFLNYSTLFAPHQLWGNVTTTGNALGYTSTDCYTNYNILSQHFDGAVSGSTNRLKFYQNGTLLTMNYLGSIGTTTSSNTVLNLGKETANNLWMNGDIAEIIVYDSALSNTNRQKVEKYLDDKYGARVNLGDIVIPYGFCDAVIRAGKNFSSYTWSTGATSDSIIVNKTGNYSVTATDIFGYPSVDSIHVQYPQIHLHDTVFCQGDSVLLDPQLTGHYNYKWSNGSTASSIYAGTAGQYWLLIKDTNNCVADTEKVNISEDIYPSLVWLGRDTIFCAGNSIGLQVGATQAVSYQWSPGGATTSTLNINTTGDYSVTATDIYGCAGVDTIHVTINGIAPSVGFADTRGCSNDSIAFADTSKVAPPATISWNWKFSDGFTSILKNPKHKFLSGGTYTVKDSVVSSTGCSGWKIKTIYINASPVAAFTVTMACISNPYTFTNQSTFLSKDSISSWTWDFGDGTAHSNQQDPSHTYISPNTYNVSLTIVSDSGCRDTVSHQLTVAGSAPPPSAFTLIQPPGNYIAANPVINFSWNNALGAVSYALEYSTDSFATVTHIPNLIHTSLQQSIAVSPKYFWRVIAYGICGNTDTSNTLKFNMFQSNSVPGLQIWLKGDSVHVNGAGIDTIYDCSGNNNNAIQSNSSNQPLKVDFVPGINNKPVIRFDGTRYMSITTNIMNNVSAYTVFAVVKYAGNGSSSLMSGNSCGSNCSESFMNYSTIFAPHELWGNATATGNAFGYITTDCYSNYNILSQHFDGTGAGNGNRLKFYQNGTLLTMNYDGSIGASTLSNTALNLGKETANNLWMDGDIAEIIVYNSVLSDNDRQKVEKYLDNKYGAVVNLGPDIWSNNLCDTTLNAGANFIHYKWSTGKLEDTLSTLVVNTGGSYSVTATDVFGFISIDTVIVHKPSVSLPDTLMACLGSNVTIHSGLGAPFMFHWSGGSTADSLVAAVPSTDSLIVYDNSGCSITKIIHVVADSFSVKVSFGPSKICTGDDVYLASGTGSAISYVWFDGSSTYITPTYPVTWLPGTNHSLWLTVTDVNGCAAHVYSNFIIAGFKPDVGFISDAGCVPLFAHFIDTTSNSVYSFWNFGNGNTGTGATPTQVYLNSGTYQITLMDTTSEGCSAKVTKPAYVYSKPVSDFSPLIGCDGVPIHFHDQSINIFGNDSLWTWNFGDPGSGASDSSKLQNPSHTYHFVTTSDSVGLIVTTQYGCKDTVYKKIIIRDAPHVGFTYTSVCDGNPVYFNDTSTTPLWNRIIGWKWDMDSGAYTSTIQNPVYTFSGGNTYPVVLTVKALNGCIVSDTENVLVHAIPNANFLVSAPCMDAPYTFMNSSSVLLPDTITQWIWNFGSLGTSTLKNPVVTFPNSTDYNITLFVQSNAGCNNMVSHDLHVNPSPVAAFQPDYYYGVAPFSVVFSDSSIGATNYSWNFGDGIGTSSLANPSYTYVHNDSLGYNVQLVVYNQYGCTNTAYHKLMVIPTIADIAVTSIDTVIQGNYVSLSANIANYGSQRIYHMYISAEPQGGTAFTETWSDIKSPLLPDNTMTYHFNGKYSLSELQGTGYICVEAQIVKEYPDNNPSNNVQCIPFKDQFIAYNPYPSPINDQLLHIDFILPTSNNVDISLYGTKGEFLAKIYSGMAVKGLNMLAINISSLSLGIYTYRIKYRDEQKILRFVKF